MEVVTGQDKFRLYNSLVCLAQGLEGRYTTVDLRNESCITGKISQVDGQMNVVMSDAVFIDARGSEFPFESFFIHARNIRYIHIPDQVTAPHLFILILCHTCFPINSRMLLASNYLVHGHNSHNLAFLGDDVEDEAKPKTSLSCISAACHCAI